MGDSASPISQIVNSLWEISEKRTEIARNYASDLPICTDDELINATINATSCFGTICNEYSEIEISEKDDPEKNIAIMAVFAEAHRGAMAERSRIIAVIQTTSDTQRREALFNASIHIRHVLADPRLAHANITEDIITATIVNAAYVGAYAYRRIMEGRP